MPQGRRGTSPMRARHHVGTAKAGAELVSDETFLRSEYYFDFARRI